jgi:hypothetical protein
MPYTLEELKERIEHLNSMNKLGPILIRTKDGAIIRANSYQVVKPLSRHFPLTTLEPIIEFYSQCGNEKIYVGEIPLNSIELIF